MAKNLVAPPALPAREKQQARKQHGTSIRMADPAKAGVRALALSRNRSRTNVINELLLWGLEAMKQAGAPELASLKFGPAQVLEPQQAPANGRPAGRGRKSRA
jgi:hypothetical protein